MGRAEVDVIKDEKNEYFKMVKIQWWVRMKIAKMGSGNVI
jgi:hypothetical protein